MPELLAPFPYFGGKRRAAPLVWDALGDVPSYVEPFCGSCAVLLARPGWHRRKIETVNDADAMLVNAWRAIRYQPDEIAAECAPVAEVELHARCAYVQGRRDREFVAWLEGDPLHCDARLAAYWIYCVSASIGPAFNGGSWHVDDGCLRQGAFSASGVVRGRPHLGNAGEGVNRHLSYSGDSREDVVRQYLRDLSRRLDRVRIICGDYRRCLTDSVLFPGVREVGLFFDPPYVEGAYLYREGDESVCGEVRKWCLTHPGLKICLCGFESDGHDELLAHGWRKIQGHGGGSGLNADGAAHLRERMWLSPACVLQPDLFGGQ